MQTTSHHAINENEALPRIDYSSRARRSHRYVWGVGQSRSEGFLSRINKIDLATTAPTTVTSCAEPGSSQEPIIVALPSGLEEDDGVLLTVVLDAHAR